jgi:hypothetical protein
MRLYILGYNLGTEKFYEIDTCGCFIKNLAMPRTLELYYVCSSFVGFITMYLCYVSYNMQQAAVVARIIFV